MNNENYNDDERSGDIEHNTETSHKNDINIKYGKQYTEKEVEEKIKTAVNDALNSEFITMLKNDHGLKDKLLKDTLLPLTSFKQLGFFKALLISLLMYSGLLAIYTISMDQPLFNPKASILILALILALIDKTFRPMILMIERSLRFKTSGFIFILICSTVVYYVNILLDNKFNIKIVFTSFYELFFIITILMLLLSIIDHLISQYLSKNTTHKILGSEEEHE